jgi:hypothetical protein
MKNVLSHKQMHQLNGWVEGVGRVGPSEFDTYTVACDTATKCLGFMVTYSNLKSSEDATGISLVKVKEVRVNNLEARIAKLENDLASFREYCKGCALPIIKPGANKPMFCHKNRYHRNAGSK